MLSTDVTDILFGTPVPLSSEVNMGSLEEDEVNIIVHGHEPLLSELILMACQDPEMIEYAKSKGAKGINLTGICCTANETLMRQGVRSAGNFLSQELAIATGAVEGSGTCGRAVSHQADHYLAQGQDYGRSAHGV
jgi:carbon-monoxide dehydrogenase catalytic subunit